MAPVPVAVAAINLHMLTSPSFKAPSTLSNARRQTAKLQATVVYCLRRDLHKPLRFFGFSNRSLHILSLPATFPVRVGEVAVDLLKSFEQNRQRVQGLLHLSVQSPDFVICLRLASVSLFLRLPFFSNEDSLEPPQVFTVDAEPASCGIAVQSLFLFPEPWPPSPSVLALAVP